MRGHRHESAETRFWRNVQKTDGCWLWVGLVDKDGYGRIRVSGKQARAHRYSYILHYGETDLWVLHRCDNPTCVRPDHLFLGTSQDNVADRTAKGRAASGHQNGHATKPEHTKRGIEHYNYQNPNAPQKGTGNGRAKLTENDVRVIRWMWSNGTLTKSAIARHFDISDTTVYNILRGKLWAHVE